VSADRLVPNAVFYGGLAYAHVDGRELMLDVLAAADVDYRTRPLVV
jgi:hypothetical protein